MPSGESLSPLEGQGFTRRTSGNTRVQLPNSYDSLDDDEPPLTRVGRYQVVSILGDGGFGRVYLGEDSQLNRKVAIKVPHLRRISDPDDLKLYLDEARTLASLDHRGVVPVYDVGSTDDGRCYVVSKYVEGSDLAARVAQGPMGVREVAELVSDIADALHYVHTSGIVHRDVKPGNILLDEQGRPFVADFGLSLSDDCISNWRSWVGTPKYMSPELARAEGHLVDGRSDLFSLGIVFYELLTGVHPFRAHDAKTTLQLILFHEPRPPRQINDRIPRGIGTHLLESDVQASD